MIQFKDKIHKINKNMKKQNKSSYTIVYDVQQEVEFEILDELPFSDTSDRGQRMILGDLLDCQQSAKGPCNVP